MSTWGEQLHELKELNAWAAKNHADAAGQSPYDILRRRYLTKLHDHTGRDTIAYATSWLENKPVPSADVVSLNLGDMHGFMEALSNLGGTELDLILTSPGGSPEAAESIVSYLRTKYDHIRAVVPVAAMSAATMMALACDEIVMARHSQLGPIDPQFTVQTPEGPRTAPGQAIIDQFEMAKEECADPTNLGAWLPLLRSLMPGLLAQCIHQRELAERFASTQLCQYMLADLGEDAEAKAEEIAAWFANFSFFKSHGRPVTIEDARDQGVRVVALEDDDELQDFVLSVHHAIRHTFAGTGVTKLIENHKGRAYLEIIQPQVVQMQGPQQPPPAPQPANPNQ